MATEPELVRGSERSPIPAGGASALGCNGTQRSATCRNGKQAGRAVHQSEGHRDRRRRDGSAVAVRQLLVASVVPWHARAHARTHACAVSPHTRAHLTPGRRSHAHTHPRTQARTNTHIDTRPPICAAPRVEHACAATLLRAQVPRHGLALRAESVRELRGANSGAPRGALAAATAAPRLHPPLPYVRRDRAHSATHLRRGSAHRCHLCAETRLAAATSAPG
jgi:hypothetical protein